MNIRKKITSIFQIKHKSVREISAEIDIPKSTIHHNFHQIQKRQFEAGTDFWDTDFGYNFLIRLVISTVYIFAVRSGFGAGTLKQFFEIAGVQFQ